MAEIGNRAVVLGGSVAGTLAARVLAEFYREVLVVDRDKVVGVTTPRRGAPHARHAHSLHGMGQRTFEELFPGLMAELSEAGIPVGDLGQMHWYFDARRLAPAQSGVTSVTALRPVLENHIRTRVAALPNVRFLEGYDITGLVATPGGERIIGARVQAQGVDSGAEQVLEADLVIDCTGRGSRTPVWLEEMGYQRPAEDRVKVNLAYTSRHFRLRPGMLDGIQSINPVASPEHPRGAFFGRFGPDGCIVSLTGILGDYPPTDPEGFLEFARTLPVPDVYQAIVDAEPLTDPVSFRFAASVRRRYEQLTRFPDGLLVMGDAVCSFNPVYGQGMIVSSLEAATLRRQLQRGTPQPRKFLAAIAKVIDAPWDISAGGDLDFPEVEGRRTLKVRIGNGYVARVRHAATQDPAVTTGFMRVAGLIDPPQALMKPGMALRVLRHATRRPEPGQSWLAEEPPVEPPAGQSAAA
jgi:2-polyprenyl-6-methoxyphenol hydroxylase-like FAD-dependent oxidoreductase